MLQSIRDKASGWLAYAVIIMISIPFALWGVAEYFGGGARLVAIEVNDTEITSRAVQREIQQQRQQLAEFFGGQIPSSLVDEESLREQAIEVLIRRELVRQTSQERGYRVSDSLVARELGAIPAFQTNGRFDRERYVRLLEAQRIGRGEFEADIALSLRMGQFESGLRDTSLVMETEALDYLRLLSEERRLSALRISAEDYARDIRIDPARVEAFYQDNLERFQTPLRLQLEYVMLDFQTLAETINISDAEIERFYRQSLDRYTSPEERRGAQILIRVDINASDSEAAAARERAQAARSRVLAGESFAAVAADVSEDQFTAADGGDLGLLQRGDLGAALDGVLFTMSAAEVSNPVRTREGFHVLKLTAIQAAISQPLDEVRDEVRQELLDRQVETRQIQLTEQLINASFENPGSLQPAAAATGLALQRSDWITADTGSGIGAVNVVRRAAFSDRLLREGRNSDLLELNDGRALVVRVAEVEEARARPLAEVAAEAEALLRAEEASSLAREAGAQALSQLQAGQTFAATVRGLPGDSWSDIQLRRDDERLPAELLQAAFALPAPMAEQPSMRGLSLDNGDYALVVLHEVIDAEADAASLQAAREQLISVRRMLEFEAALQSLQDAAKVRIFRDNL
ncbi:peptidyl-prolyl cis-trans isomerase D [Ectothiorhodosinus mongolicus]|uniref:Periplasmic chaperone PpiD n=1 Tax=Ectothiorhodosinus mongolicus TaxID=233100 RepID=A0A1R3VNX9_9GAMM|nr:SurA N-terminal domain-containing protein [Ectothiorhodosinus mongolicus]ULX56564.1 peptidylprolyl isomerase [Ectothiorhodosinus mongolicus]SIT66336.1 peptidyl-prolyl cis-trans isomerase D [Ectothiorhodosinus mongolicus]